MLAVLDRLLRTPPTPAPVDSLDDWWQRHVTLAAELETPVDVALAGGFAADRLGYAFASGYQAAAASLLGAGAARAAFCVTEEGGAHPRAIATRLTPDGDGYRLDGAKLFVTLGPAASALYVVASTGASADGKNQLRVARIDAARAGVTMTVGAPLAFVPEIPHAVIRFEAVRVADSDLLPGDGYLDFVKPFRTVEDLHVHAALVGWLVQIARRAAEPELVEAALATAAAVRALTLCDPRAASVHVALAGVLAGTRALVGRFDPIWARLDATTRERWERDRPLLEVASRARGLRREAAWKALG
jgi:acyl-CoA dehydrogenase